MIVLIEGIDKSGKTTLIREISRILPGSTVFKNKIKPGKGDLEIGRIAGIYQGAYQLANAGTKLILFDRSHITEIVYSYLRGYESSSKITWNLIERELLQGAVIIYNYAPPSVIQRRFKEEKEEYLPTEEIEHILNRYEACLDSTTLPVLPLSSLDPVDSNVAKAIEFISNHK